MRALEIALLVVVAVPLLITAWWPRPTRAVLVVGAASVTAVLAAVHVLVEGVRWQLTPMYVVAAVLGVVALVRLRRTSTDPRTRASRLLAGGGLLAVVTAAVVGWAVPVVGLPAPSGTRPIGTTALELTDDSRQERYSEQEGDHRRLAVQAWYPAGENGPGERWAAQADALTSVITDRLGLPDFALGHLALLRSNAAADAPIDEAGPYPLVVYSHGWGSFRGAQSTQMEELASQGYVVVAIDHTYASLATLFPDGEVVPIEPSALPQGADSDQYDTAARTLVEVFASDIEFVLDQLGDGLAEQRFDDLVDLEDVALMGHSTGGGASVMACVRSSVCDAVIGFDPWLDPVPDSVVGDGLDQPMLSIRSEEWAGGDNDTRLRRLHVASEAPARLLHIRGTKHGDFTLLSLLTPLGPELGVSGKTPGGRTHEIVNRSVLDFLDQSLRGDGEAGDVPGEPPSFAELVDDGLVGGSAD